MSRSYELTRCIVCGDGNSVTIAGPEEIREETELLWAFHMRRLSPRTPPDRLVDRVAFSQPPPWRVVRCSSCGLVFRNPVEDRERVHDGYARAAPPREAILALHSTQRGAFRAQIRRLRKHVGRRGTGLELGSYAGAFLAAARRAHWQFEGLDVSESINVAVRELGFTVHDGDLESFQTDRAFDTVVIWNTFDQLPDPRATVRAAQRVLRPNGVLAIRVPNGECYADWRARLASPARHVASALMAHNNLLSFPYRFGFTPSSLGRLLRDHGFVVEQIVGDTLVPTADEWTRWWAVWEERLIKPLTRLSAPWFEVYARRA